MNFLHAIILGIIQGVGEFLPISSSGHLVVIPYIFGWDYQGLNFDVALHFGTVLALITFFWKDWMSIISNAISTDDACLPDRQGRRITPIISFGLFLSPLFQQPLPAIF